MGLINKEQEYQDQEAWSNDVQKLKGYKEFKENVEYWYKQTNDDDHPIIKGSYEIVYDDELCWCVDVEGDVSFISWGIKEIPFQFRNIDGDFGCDYCWNLISLKGCPIYVSGDFSCEECDELTSLKGCPKYVGGEFDCYGCKNIRSLKGCPLKIEGDFYCDDCGKQFTENYIKSLCSLKGEIYN